MQTFGVHWRRPRRLLDELGWWRTAGVAVLGAGLVLTALVHPWFYVAVLAEAAGLIGPAGGEGRLVGADIGGVSLVSGYLVAMSLGVVAVWRRGWPGLAPAALLMPLYWLMISFAAYRALWQLVEAPFHWEKTAHGAGLGQQGRPPHSGG
jgi:hypothetical protein